MKLKNDYRNLEFGWSGGFSEAYCVFSDYFSRISNKAIQLNSYKNKKMIKICDKINEKKLKSKFILEAISKLILPCKVSQENERKFVCDVINSKENIISNYKEIINFDQMIGALNLVLYDDDDDIIDFFSQFLCIEIVGSDGLKSDKNVVVGALEILNNNIEEEKRNIEEEKRYQAELKAAQDKYRQEIENKKIEIKQKYKDEKEKELNHLENEINIDKYELLIKEIDKKLKEKTPRQKIIDIYKEDLQNDPKFSHKYSGLEKDLDSLVNYVYLLPLKNDVDIFLNDRPDNELNEKLQKVDKNDFKYNKSNN